MNTKIFVSPSRVEIVETRFVMFEGKQVPQQTTRTMTHDQFLKHCRDAKFISDRGEKGEHKARALDAVKEKKSAEFLSVEESAPLVLGEQPQAIVEPEKIASAGMLERVLKFIA